jgi:hypothetical protein
MEILWAQGGGEITGREVADQLPDSGRKIRFTPVGSPGAHAAVLMRQAMAVGSDPDTALATFARSLSPSEAATLRRALGGAGLEAAGSAS